MAGTDSAANGATIGDRLFTYPPRGAQHVPYPFPAARHRPPLRHRRSRRAERPETLHRRRPGTARPRLRPAGLARRAPPGLHTARDRHGGQPRPQRPVARRPRCARRRVGPAPPDPEPRLRRLAALGPGRPRPVFPLDPQRQLAGVAHRPRRRRAAAGDGAAARCRFLRGVAARRPARRLDGGVPRLRRPQVHHRPQGCAGQAEGERPGLRPAVRAPLGHLEGRHPVAALHPIFGRRRQGRRARQGLGIGARRCALQALRRRRGLRLQPRRLAHRVQRPSRRPQRTVVDQLRPLRGARRRLRAGAQPHRRQQGLGRPPRVPRGRQSRLARHGPARLRGRPLQGDAARRARRRRPSSSRSRAPAAPPCTAMS